MSPMKRANAANKNANINALRVLSGDCSRNLRRNFANRGGERPTNTGSSTGAECSSHRSHDTVATTTYSNETKPCLSFRSRRAASRVFNNRISTLVFLLRKGRLQWSRTPQPPLGSAIATNFSRYVEKDNIGAIELNGLPQSTPKCEIAFHYKSYSSRAGYGRGPMLVRAVMINCYTNDVIKNQSLSNYTGDRYPSDRGQGNRCALWR
jgi:hypothetical protein